MPWKDAYGMPFSRCREYEHGTYLRYLFNKCRCEPCRQDATLRRNKHRVHNARHGPVNVPAADLRRDVAQLKKTGMTLAEIARRAGVSRNTLNGPLLYTDQENVRATTFNKVHAVWQDVFGDNGELYDPLHPYRPKKMNKGRAVWPREALKQKYLKRYGGMTEHASARLNHHNPLMTTPTAEQVAIEMGFLPWEVWDGWNERTVAAS